MLTTAAIPIGDLHKRVDPTKQEVLHKRAGPTKRDVELREPEPLGPNRGANPLRLERRTLGGGFKGWPQHFNL